MKKILVLLVLFICSFVQSQDFNYLASLNNIPTDTEALAIAKNIASAQTKSLRLLIAKEFTEEHVYMIRFVPEEMTNEQYDKLDLYAQSNFLTVTFNIDFIGENKDLQRIGIKTYKFKQIKGTYLQIFPVWKKYYRPEAELEATLTNSKMQKFVDFPKKLDFYIQDDNDLWILYNQSRS